MLRGYRLAGFLVTVTLAGAISACGHSAAAVGPNGVVGVSCTNYALHAKGRYHDEVSVRVQVNNSTAHAARYTVDVKMSTSRPRRADAPATEVTIDGSVAPRTSAELGHKVLTTDPVKQCRVIRVSRP